jgi:hypothetical protein
MFISFFGAAVNLLIGFSIGIQRLSSHARLEAFAKSKLI